jgi:tRNA-specific 2-thiouridylase
MTVGQRRGVLPGRDGEKRYVARVDVGARRIEVGRLEDILVTRIDLVESSLSFTHSQVPSGEKVLGQWSAHGRTQLVTLWREGACFLEVHEPVRPVAPGQSVVLYRVDEPTIVVGAAIVARP